ncbi:A disintegrin and metalloproteinase with thrombospondin motifs 16 [Araneus ventricosus]|uniref:A disintegrin and metalloproteinase with thrombospondin motifs 16 n=1 Tax=Araneus ventricosus TaxID=182803 RepID=A0A4Y2HYY5_ARAVE|nr:A disintegrin and metalloproteinase with thrombospondin motifs 16 [Araneus ventricosus]
MTDKEEEKEGTIGDNLVVKPVPAVIWNLDSELFLDADEERSNFSVHHTNSSSSEEFSTTSNSCPHFVYRSQISSNESYTNFFPLNEVLNNFNTSGADGHRSKRSSFPSHAWPEVLLLVDYDIYSVHGFSKKEARRYYVSFLNGVDLRFKAISNPKINLILSGIVVAESREATPYLEFNRVSSPKGDLLDGDRALDDLAHYLYAVDGLPEYDLAVVLTRMDMCIIAGRECSQNINGYAIRAGACSVFKGLERVNKIAIVEDKGGFGGIITAAHEIGHLLGAVHDGFPDTHGRPGASRCSFDDGFIMSYNRVDERAFQWSWCSIQQFRHFLNSEEASCLFNKPNHNVMAGSELPGTVLSLDGQCKREVGTYACAVDPKVCTLLFCYNADGRCWASRGAAEGSHCGGGHVSRNPMIVQSLVSSLYLGRFEAYGPISFERSPVSSSTCKDKDASSKSSGNIGLPSSSSSLLIT